MPGLASVMLENGGAEKCAVISLPGCSMAAMASGWPREIVEIRTALTHVFRTRAATGALVQGGDVWIVETDDQRVFAFGRYHPRRGRLLGVANVAEVEVDIALTVFEAVGLSRRSLDVLGTPGVGIWDDRLHIPPLTLAWFTDSLGECVVPF